MHQPEGERDDARHGDLGRRSDVQRRAVRGVQGGHRTATQPPARGVRVELTAARQGPQKRKS